MTRVRRRSAVWSPCIVMLGAGLMALAGCVVPTANFPAAQVDGEPNDTFDEADDVKLDDAGLAAISGVVQNSDGVDFDVYRISPIKLGDHLVIDTATAGSALDVSVAVYDEESRLIYANDDFGSGLDAYVDMNIRHAGEGFVYLVVSHSAFASANRMSGAYSAEITVSAGTVPSPAAQHLVLDWDGGEIDSAPLGPTTIDVFSAEAISGVYEGDTERLKQVIVETMEQNFERYNITISTTDDPLPSGDFSRIFFGSFSSRAFGIAENVDLYNADFCDDAIIYAESFRPTAFGIIPTVDELGLAIGNIAAHEAGHLLGLNHVDDDSAIMDGSAPAITFIQDQEFKEAPVNDDILPIGTQDAALLLSETLGLRP